MVSESLGGVVLRCMFGVRGAKGVCVCALRCVCVCVCVCVVCVCVLLCVCVVVCVLFDVALCGFVVSRSAVGLVVKYLVAIEMPRVRFPDGASFFASSRRVRASLFACCSRVSPACLCLLVSSCLLVFSCLSVCLFVCLSVCLFVCLSACLPAHQLARSRRPVAARSPALRYDHLVCALVFSSSRLLVLLWWRQERSRSR